MATNFPTLDNFAAFVMEQAVLDRCRKLHLDQQHTEHELNRASFLIEDGLLREYLGEIDWEVLDVTVVGSPSLEQVEVESVIRRPDGTLFMRTWDVVEDTFSDTEQKRPHSYAAVLEELQDIAWLQDIPLQDIPF